MLKCKDCSRYLDATEENTCNGICPQCKSKNLGEIVIICPQCHANLKDASRVDMNTIGWCCRVCNIKIYKDL